MDEFATIGGGVVRELKLHRDTENQAAALAASYEV